jgi:hypothetical protein
VTGDFPGLDLTGVKLKNILSLQLFLQMGNVSLARGDILLFLLKKMQEIFLIVRAWIELCLVSDGKASVGFLMKAENINWLFQINLEEQKIRLQ